MDLPAPFIEYPLLLRTALSSFAGLGIHQRMLQDETRVKALARAIERVVAPGMMVADIGAGTGLLSCLAAAAGAKQVFAVEATALARVTRQTIVANGLAAKVTVIEGDARAIELPTKVDLVISETLGHIGIDEGILELMADARARHAVPGAILLPRRVRVLAQPVCCPAFENRVVGFWQGRPHGIDFSAMARFATRQSYLTTAAACEQLAAAQVVFNLELGPSAELPLVGTVRFDGARRTKLFNGYLLTFAAELAEEIHIESRQSQDWRPVFLPLPEPVELEGGEIVELTVRFSAPDVPPTWSSSP